MEGEWEEKGGGGDRGEEYELAGWRRQERSGFGREVKNKALRRCDEDLTKLTYETWFNSHGAERQMERTRSSKNCPLKVLFKSQCSLQI